MSKRSKLQIVEDSRHRLATRERELDATRRLVVKETLAAIFEALGIPVAVGENYNDHHAQGVTVRAEMQGTTRHGFAIEATANHVEITTFVKDEQDERLKTFKRVWEATK